MDWIKTSDGFPPIDEIVIVLASKLEDWNWKGDKEHYQNQMFIGSLDDRDSWECVFGDSWTPFSKEEATHWMPLPALPKEITDE